MHWGDVSSWVAAIVAAAVAIRAFISERRANGSAAAAENQRQRTVAAAERSAKAVEDVAAAIRDSAVSTASPVAAQRGPTWGLEHRAGSVYALINNTAFPQAEVTVTGAPVRRNGGPHAEIKAFSEIEFLGSLTAQTTDRTITVQWTDQNGDRQQWSKPLTPNL